MLKTIIATMSISRPQRVREKAKNNNSKDKANAIEEIGKIKISKIKLPKI